MLSQLVYNLAPWAPQSDDALVLPQCHHLGNLATFLATSLDPPSVYYY